MPGEPLGTAGVCPPPQGHREVPGAHPGLAPTPSLRPPGTDQVYQLLIADLPLVVALCQGHQHVQFGGVQGQLMAVHQAGERLHADEAGVFRVELRAAARSITGMPGPRLPARLGTPPGASSLDP